MTNASPLSGSHLRTYTMIFQHPQARNLEWHEVHALFRQIGRVEEEPNGNLKVTRNGQVLVLHPPRKKDIDEADDVLALRSFLERSEPVAAAPGGAVARWLLVIDHREARIFHVDGGGSVTFRIRPPGAGEFFRHAARSDQFSRGKEKPDPDSYFGPVAEALRLRGEILLFGTGTGMSDEMGRFVAWAKEHDPGVAARIVATVVVDEHHLSQGQLLAKAREILAGPRPVRMA